MLMGNITTNAKRLLGNQRRYLNGEKDIAT